MLKCPQKRTVFKRCGQIFPGGGMLCEKPLQKIGFRRALLLIKPAHTGHHPGAVPGFRPSPGNSEETTTRVSTQEISVLFSACLPGNHTPGIPGISGSTWEHTHPGAYPGIGTRVFPGGRWEPRNNPGQNLGKTRVLGLSRVFPGWCCWGLRLSRAALS